MMTINNDTDEMQASSSGTNINQCQPIVNGLLTYLISMMNNSTDPKLVEVTGRYFDLGQVKDSKSLLCDVAHVPFKKRQDIESRTEKVAHIRDIVDIIRKLDRDSTMPLFVVDAIGLAKLPRINAEDISYVSVAEKMSDIYNRMELLSECVGKNSVTIRDNSDKIKNIVEGNNVSYSNIVKSSAGIHIRNASPTALMSPVAMTVSRMPTTPIPSSSSPSVFMTPISMPSTSISPPAPLHESCDVIHPRSYNETNVNRTLSGTIRTTSPARGNTPPEHSSSGTSVSSLNHNAWQTIKGRAKSSRVSYKRMRIQGTVSGSNVKGAPLPTRSMFISRVDRETSDDNMRDWISKQKINIINFERLSHDDAKYKSYKLIVSVSDYVSLCKPSQWPVGICISKYHPPKATEIQNNGIN